jgi:hypothetical protein
MNKGGPRILEFFFGYDRREQNHPVHRDYCICAALKVAPNSHQREASPRAESRLQALNDIGWE